MKYIITKKKGPSGGGGGHSLGPPPGFVPGCTLFWLFVVCIRKVCCVWLPRKFTKRKENELEINLFWMYCVIS